MQLQITVVQLALAKMLNHYPESGHTATSIAKLAFDWHDLLSEEGVTQKQFSAGVRHAVKTCRFFPKLADVLAGVKEYRERPPRPQTNALQIEATTSHHDLTSEEIERNKERIEMCLKVFRKEVALEDAVAFVEQSCRIRDFSGTMEG